MGKAQRELLQAMRAQRWELTGAAVLGFIASASAVALLGTSAWLIATAAGAPPVITLAVAAVLVRTFALSRAIFRYLERLTGHDAAFRGLTGLRIGVYSQLERLAPAGIGHFGRGDLLTRLVADVDAAVDLPLRVILPWTQAAFVCVGAIAFFWWLLPSAAVFMIVVFAFGVALIPWLVGRVTAKAEARLAPLRSELASALVTAFSASSDLQAFGAVDRAREQLAAIDARLTALGRRESIGLGLAGALMTAAQGIGVIASLCLVIPHVVDGGLSSVWLAVAALLPIAVFDVFATVPGAAIAEQRVRSSAERVRALAEIKTPVSQADACLELPAGFRGLELAGVAAQWDEAATLRDLSFEIAPGEHVFLVGPSGAGKSTLASVLMGFLDYTGSVRINAVELRQTDHEELRARVGLLEQRAHIFGTTIEENITLGRDSGGMTEILSRAQLTEMVGRLPEGAQTQLGAFGTSISGGEAQRIGVARLLVDPRPFVILDEPTAHLDQATARSLDRELQAVFADSTTITITHHLLDIPAQARVLVLVDGVLVADGVCAELALCEGWFADQCSAQREIELISLERGTD